MTYPIPVLKIASDVPTFTYVHHETWQSLYQQRMPDADIISRITINAASEIARKFVDDVVKRSEIQITDEEHGKQVRVSCLTLTRNQLLDVLYKAYREGQTDGMQRSSDLAYNSNRFT